jgi:hypothetical protein
MSKSKTTLSLEDRAINKIYGDYQRSAKKRKLEFALSRERFAELIQQPCYYNQIEKSNNYNGYRYNGLDRIDSTKGYIEGNVVPCCKYCNRAKSDMRPDSFTAWVFQIFRLLKNRVVGDGSLKHLDKNSLQVMDELTLGDIDGPNDHL